MTLFTSPTDAIPGTLARAAQLNNLDAAVDTAFSSLADKITFISAGIQVSDGTADGIQLIYSADDAYIINTDPDGLLVLQARNAADAATNTLLSGDPDGAVELYYDNSKKFETSNTGGILTGILITDGLTLGDNEDVTLGAGPDAKISSNGTALVIENGAGTETMLIATQTGAIELYYNNSKKFETDAAGITITGNVIVTGTVDGVDVANATGLLATAREWTAQQNFNESAITSTGNAVAWDMDSKQCAIHTLTENTTISAPTNLNAGGTYILRVVQAAGVFTLAWNAVFEWGISGTPAAPAANGDVVICSFYSDGTNLYGVEMNRTEA